MFTRRIFYTDKDMLTLRELSNSNKYERSNGRKNKEKKKRHILFSAIVMLAWRKFIYSPWRRNSGVRFFFNVDHIDYIIS